jgi:beta-glucosidase
MKSWIMWCGIGMIALGLNAQTPPANPPTDSSPMDSFVNGLMRRMTLEEKIGQLNLLSVGFDVTGPIVSQDVDAKIRQGLVGGVFNTYTPVAARRLQALAVEQSRLHIPLLLGYDVIHGHKTIFPIPLAMSCTWDMDLIRQSARIAATEATADGLNWTFSPMVDIARDPRWGRIAEGAGEDPYLGSLVARAMVQGYQGDDLSRSNALLACVKHFALYGAVEAGRDYNTVDMSRLRMYEYYLPPYRAAIAAGAGSVMTSFNEVDALPATGNRWLLTDLLRDQWGFKGLVVTDYTSIQEMTQHGMGDLKQDVALALNAGTEMDMVSEGFLKYAGPLVKAGAVSETTINEACRRILETKYKLGLFTDPYRGCSPERAADEIFTPENRKAARAIAERSLVLLKNDRQTLPLKRAGVIALIGPPADDQPDLLGTWSAAGDWRQVVSILDGIKNVAGPAVTVLAAKGANLVDDSYLFKTLNASGAKLTLDPRSPSEMIAEAVATASLADVVVAVLGESRDMSGEAASRSEIGIPDSQEKLLRALVATGKPVVLVLLNGRPLTLTWENEHCQAILDAWFGGTEAGNAVAAVLFGDYNPSGKLTTTFPRDVGQIPLYYNHKNTGRPYDGNTASKYLSRYLDIPNDPLYPFGYGLSYTTFSYSDVRLDRTSLTNDETLTASVTVTNTGRYAGEEIVQLYITEPVASVTRSVEDLRGFQKISLAPGESREVVFPITTEALKFYNSELHYDWEPGDFIIRIGPNSQQLHSATVHWSRSFSKTSEDAK